MTVLFNVLEVIGIALLILGVIHFLAKMLDADGMELWK